MRQPNILFLFPDQLRHDWTGANPDLPLRTSHLDALNARGTRFSNAVCPSPLCAPCRASIASGREYPRSPVLGNEDNLPPDRPTLYSHLRDAGYHTMACGKLDLNKGDCIARRPAWGLNGRAHLDAWGFSDGINNEGKMDGANSGREKPQGPYMHFLEERGLRQVHIDDFSRRTKLSSFATDLPDDAYCDNWIGQNGLNLLAAAPADRPWFLQVNFTGPHNPWDITERMKGLYSDVDFPQPNAVGTDSPEALLDVRRNYAAMVENIDDWIGVYIDVLRDRGELDHTLIVFSSDHGEMLGDHDRWGKSLPHQPSIGVPLTVAGPGVRKGATVSAPSTILDLVATFLQTGGAVPLPAMDSRSLWPLLTGQVEATRPCVFSALEEWRVAFDGRYKLVEWGEASRRAMYDLKRDPSEMCDISGMADVDDVQSALVEHLRSYA